MLLTYSSHQLWWWACFLILMAARCTCRDAGDFSPVCASGWIYDEFQMHTECSIHNLGPRISHAFVRDFHRLYQGSMNIAILGGSVTHGVEVGDLNRYSNVLGRLLAEAGRKDSINNCAVKGSTSAWCAGSFDMVFEKFCERHETPDLFLIDYGVNDHNTGNSILRSQHGIEALVRVIETKFPAALIIILETCSVDEGYRRVSKMYDTPVLSWACAVGYPQVFIPSRDTGQYYSNWWPHVHPNKVFHENFARLISESFEQLNEHFELEPLGDITSLFPCDNPVTLLDVTGTKEPPANDTNIVYNGPLTAMHGDVTQMTPLLKALTAELHSTVPSLDALTHMYTKTTQSEEQSGTWNFEIEFETKPGWIARSQTRTAAFALHLSPTFWHDFFFASHNKKLVFTLDYLTSYEHMGKAALFVGELDEALNLRVLTSVSIIEGETTQHASLKVKEKLSLQVYTTPQDATRVVAVVFVVPTSNAQTENKFKLHSLSACVGEK